MKLFMKNFITSRNDFRQGRVWCLSSCVRACAFKGSILSVNRNIVL
jgi:hypothetical protein